MMTPAAQMRLSTGTTALSTVSGGPEPSPLVTT